MVPGVGSLRGGASLKFLGLTLKGDGLMLPGEWVDSHGIGLIHGPEKVWKKIQLS